MNEGDSSPRGISERRLRSDRRRGLERRLGERRYQFLWVDVEQRAPGERRAVARRDDAPRRRGLVAGGVTRLSPPA